MTCNISLCFGCLHWTNSVLGRSLMYDDISVCLIVQCGAVQRITEQPPLTSIMQKSCLVLFSHLARMDESADARRILTAVPQSDWKRPAGRPHTSWLATMKNDLSFHNLSVEDATKLALEVIGSKRSYALNYCKSNDDDDDDVKTVCALCI